MRIRKRQVPFPLSSLSPVPLSDLQYLHQSPVVQLQLHNNNTSNTKNLFQEDDTAAYFNPPSSSDQSNQPIGVATTSSSGNNTHKLFSDDKDVININKQLPEGKDCPVGEVWLQKEDEKGGDGESSNDIRKGSFLGAETENMLVLQQSNSSQLQGRWCQEEKAFPLKKRRGNLERRSSNYDETTMAKDNVKMKTKMNKKCLQRNGNNSNEVEQDSKEIKEGVVDGGGCSSSTTTSNAKKRVRGGALMEGSRCSRVNGRGWRCCQQTLVGYSLCEHHLGKGRLRSMTNVRSRSMAGTTAQKKSAMSSQPLSTTTIILSSSDEQELQKHVSPVDNKLDRRADHEGIYEKKSPLMISKRKMKLGTVKARSISSLLGQANDAVAAEENCN